VQVKGGLHCTSACRDSPLSRATREAAPAIPLDRGPFTSSTSIVGEEAAMRIRTLDVSPVIDEHGYALGVLALTP
jgi:hypothetical protein